MNVRALKMQLVQAILFQVGPERPAGMRALGICQT